MSKATKQPKQPKEKTREEKQAELDQEKKNAWENFQKLEYDKMDEAERIGVTRHLYDTMATKLTPEPVHIPYDFWKVYDDTDEIKEVKTFMAGVDSTLDNIPKNPTADSWLDKTRGIVPNMKREWKAKLEPFQREHTLRKQIEKKANEIFNLPENQGKEISIDVAKTIQEALKNIEDTVYLPVRAKIEKIEEQIKKKVGKK